MALLQIFAGEKAFEKIQKNGLSPEDVSTVFGASGAAKWLAIYGLDRAIFDSWLPQSQNTIRLFGTSVGAWKLAAAAQNKPAEALSLLANAYINQYYEYDVKPKDVVCETNKIINAFLPADKVVEILNSSRYRYSCGAVKSKGVLANEDRLRLGLAMLKGLSLSALKKPLMSMMDRVIFSDQRDAMALSEIRSQHYDGQLSREIALNSDNFVNALRASGSIPVIMDGVDNISGAAEGIYRDGGLLDYHPIPNRIFKSPGLTLYPHFYSHLTPNWFDKFYRGREAKERDLSEVVMLSPSPEFIAKLPDARLPDRKDFRIFRGNNEERAKRWNFSMNESLSLGQEFLDLCKSGEIASRVKPFSQ